MYQHWPWGGTAAASPTAGYVQPTASGQVAAPQWPAGYSQYAVTPELQQQWAAWASQAQYAYGGSVPVGQVPTTTTYTGGYPEYQTASNDAKASQSSDNNAQSSEQQKKSTEELVPQDISESEKLKQLKEQAQQWKTLQQPAAASWSYSTAATGATVNATTVTSSADSLKPHVLASVNAPESASIQSQMDKEEEEFERQFKEWEKQFEAWKEQNINHPDKEAFAQYEKQWQEWRSQLLQKKEQMQKAKAERLAAQAGLSDGNVPTSTAGTVGANSATGTNVADAAATVSNPSMYYQAAQYMYMQPYMYPGNVPVPQSVPQQYPYGPPPAASSGDNYNNQPQAMPPTESGVLLPPTSDENQNMDPKGLKNFDHGRERPKFGPGRKNVREDEIYQRYEGFENSNSYPPEIEEGFQRDWKYPPPRGRGRGGRGRGRARGRGLDRWSDAPTSEMKTRPGGDLNPRPVFPECPGEFPDSSMSGPPPPFEYPPEDFHDDFPPEELPYPEDHPRRGFPPEDRFPFREGPQPFPRDEFDKPFPPPPPPRPFDDRFHPESERFPPGPLLEDGCFEREYERYPPDDDVYGPPPFRDDFPPFEERFPPNRGRFPGRGRRFPRGAEFDRFGPPPFPPAMRDDCPYGPPDFLPPPDDRFGFPGDLPPRMPHGRGMRPPFDPGFSSGRGRFPDERFYGDGPPPRFKSIDYTHRPASVVMGEDFDPHYEYESEFQDDVMQFRDNFSSCLNVAPRDPIIFSQVNVESFDYGHGMKPMTSTTVQAKKIKDTEVAAPSKVFDYSHRRERSPLHRDRPFSQEKNGERSLSFRERERDLCRNRDRERNRDRDRDNEKERERDRDRKESNRDTRDRERDNRDRDREKDRDRDRDVKRERDWERDRHRDSEEGEKRFKWDKTQDNERSFPRDKSASESNSKKEIDIKTVDSSGHFKAQHDIFKNETCSETTLIEDLLLAPKRLSRPKQLVIILRGLPGSGKTYVAKLIKDREIENGGSAPRILSLDDYFMVEAEVTDTDPDTGKRVKRKEFKFEYELGMEEAYRSSLFKSFKKTIDDRFFPFIIVDAVHEKTKQYEQYWSYAKQRGFQVYIAEMDCKDPVICHKRNIHNRTLEDITKILENWELKPRHYISIDVRSLLQDVAITEVEMEVESDDKKDDEKDELFLDNEKESGTPMPFHVPSRWEKLEATEEKLDQLDGLRVNKKKHSSMEDYLQLPDDYEERKCEPGKKRVRWADLEEKKEQDRLRAIGFVVGQTDWTKLTDPTHADRALTRTKYF